MERTRRAIKRRVQKPIPSKNAARFITIWVVGSKHFRRYILEELITKLLTYAIFSITRRRDYTGAHIYMYTNAQLVYTRRPGRTTYISSIGKFDARGGFENVRTDLPFSCTRRAYCTYGTYI